MDFYEQKKAQVIGGQLNLLYSFAVRQRDKTLPDELKKGSVSSHPLDFCLGGDSCATGSPNSTLHNLARCAVLDGT